MEKTKFFSKDKFFNKERWLHYLETLKYALYVITHPFDGFWDLTHEKRGSLSAATTIFILVLLTNVWKVQYTSFIFNHVQWEYYNVFMDLIPMIIIFAIWCVSNWSLTTLMDGKGKLGQIYMGTAYAMTPFVLIQIPMIIISHFITEDEKSYYIILDKVSLIWCVLLIIAAMMMIHDYELGKCIFSIIITIVGMMVIVFLILMFFSLITQSFGYVISLYKELSFRMF